ncbi:1-acyl-sn-glycerol-3-phosphate acyltransferase [Brevirhabdus pacifica]|uniref:1-acyl-sn-glycerol-3-phosphate acyltransferase n=1 Tax=Brevirhabdus pacifica TaxID=1267768 RepID=A0A1U7DEX1_9RHOB|nr:1-acyl-sn-glycerol-3-phosphate acyltransferase [Brevirhabdus pacifica]OWU79842.1 acyl-phosphate glycerol 3-phosphate acyltransferase [Loktanella sp. 22II-4b]PJJ86967.1 lyso-ornithine lipid acyltransferase [Brevirhabdus pacifica]
MTPTWRSDEPEPRPASPRGAQWLRVALKGTALGVVIFGGLGLLLALRLLERPLCGVRRPVTPYVTQAVCRAFFAILGMTHRTAGKPASKAGAVVANHSSWLDIFALNARQNIYFVSKAEVAAWPGIGWLARATGTVFISRRARDAAQQKSLFHARLQAGHKLLFFPEGTSSDGLRVLPFKSTLFGAFFADELRDGLEIQPVTLCYTAPPGADPRFYGWWGDMEFGEHLLAMLAAPRHGAVTVTYHAPVKVNAHGDRKQLAARLEQAVRDGMG